MFAGLDVAVDVLAGTTGGVAMVLAGQSLDTAKVKMQLSPNKYRTLWECLKITGRTEGLRGLYAGTVPAIAANCADNAVMFAAYGQCQKAVAAAVGIDDTARLSCAQNTVAASVASLFTSVVVCPTELVKIRIQGSRNIIDPAWADGRPAGHVMRDVWKAGKAAGFFRGMTATVARECAGNAVFFGVYECARERLRPAGGRKEDCGPAATTAAGAAAGLCSSLVVYPLDAIKSRVQMDTGPSGWFRLLREQARKTGLRSALYSGLKPSLIKSVPVAGVLLCAVEVSKPFYRTKLVALQSVEWPPLSWPEWPSPPVADNFQFCDFASGWMAGVVSTFSGHPMDTVKTVQQVTDTDMLTATRDVYVRDKLKGYFRGMMFPVLSSGFVNSVFFGVNRNTMRLIQTLRGVEADGDGQKDVRFCCDAVDLHWHWHLDVFVSGCVAGAFCTTLNIPIELIKTKLQLTRFQSLEKPTQTTEDAITGPIKMTINMFKKKGLRSLFRGGNLLMIRDVPSYGVYMLAYEHLCSTIKRPYSEFKYSAPWFNVEEYTLNDSEGSVDQTMPILVQMIAGGLAGVICWVLVLPIDVVKSKMVADNAEQPKYRGVWDCVVKTYRSGGAVRFFRGFWMICVRAFPVSAIAFGTYEGLLYVCEGVGVRAEKELETN